MSAYKCYTFKKAQRVPQMHIFGDPIDALTCAVDYLRKGYQVRLGQECVEALATLAIPNRRDRSASKQKQERPENWPQPQKVPAVSGKRAEDKEQSRTHGTQAGKTSPYRQVA